LVIWLSAQGAESIVACYRQLMADTTGTDVQGKDTDEVISEVKARLFRSKVPWLLVFDNLEDRSLLQKFIPHGGTCGHVLVTTRSVETDVYDQSTMILGCFSPSESIQLLCCIANISGEVNVAAASQLAEQLGHLPLALSMAAAYMLRCDVDCSEYLARYIHSGNRALLGHQVVASSLALSLNAIKTENQLAWEMLRLLCWLGPDQITKALVRSLLRAKHFYDVTEAEAKVEAQAVAHYEAQMSKANSDAMRAISRATLVGSLALLSSFVLERNAKGTNRLIGVRIVLNSVVALSMAVAYTLSKDKRQLTSASSPTQRVVNSALVRSTSYSSVEFEQTDSIWKIVKSFSLLVVKNSEGSIHRLLAQALRTSQTEEAGCRNLQICVHALEQAWNFKPEHIDTWQESAHMLEHLKAIVAHSLLYPKSLLLKTAVLSKEAGVFSAMALNRFEEAKDSLVQSLDILDRIENSSTAHVQARVAALYELGRVFRYLGSFQKSEDALQKALAIRNHLASENANERHGIATILYEFGVLEVKKHSLDSAANFLQRALDLRRILEAESACEGIEAECAATLHQLAAVHVARKPPSLVTAEALLEEALGLRMQIGQRAATLKQLARVAIRRGEFDRAELSLRQALELYTELYGEAALHINVAAVKFQQGALAFQRQQLGQAWQFYSECLRARRHIYAYIQGNHLEVSSALHELGRVAFAQRFMVEAKDMLQSERKILEQLWETSSQDHRMLQARLTNIVWLRKCAKELGDDDDVRKLTIQRNNLKQHEKDEKATKQLQSTDLPRIVLLRQEALRCRSVVRQVALSGSPSTDTDKAMLRTALENLAEQIKKCPPNSLHSAAATFHATISGSLELSRIERKVWMLKACDLLR
jgi:tetratricopeptide (TPR) repeat protein